MKIMLAICAVAASLAGCAVVPVDYGYRGDARYYRGDGYHDGQRYYRDDRHDRGYIYQDHGQ